MNLWYFAIAAGLSLLVAHSASAAASTSSDLVQPIEPAKLDLAFFLPGGRSFDSTDWKNHIDRFKMLFELYSLNLLNAPTDKVQQLLGPPDRKYSLAAIDLQGTPVQNETAHYQLGKINGINVLLEIYYLSGRLASLRLIQHDQRGFCYFEGNWHTENFSKGNIAASLNRHYFLVGAPVQALPALLDWSQDASDPNLYNTAGPYENSALELSLDTDGKRVSRFRFLKRVGARLEEGEYSQWQVDNLRPDPRCYVTAAPYKALASLLEPDFLYLRRRKFTSTGWKDGHDTREDMLFDLVHSCPIIGMSREKIHDLLGSPTCCEDDTASLPARRPMVLYDSKAHDSELYQITFPWCGTGGHSYFQLAYSSNDCVRAFRRTHRSLNSNAGDTVVSECQFAHPSWQ